MKTIEEIGHFSDIPLEVLVELDRKILSVRDILGLDKGSVIKMNRSAGENLDILVGGALLAFGEIVIIESSMGVRITDFNIEE
ncbi:MAG TPA: FliM/FliN family flagellar motor switch protein [Bryobacteraceae bacterium]|nr:FliM/FliN family flagellar motor switch protein [Bryobacteraceae bacterium]